MTEHPAPDNFKALSELALLGSYIARPLSHLADDYLGLTPLNAASLKQLSSLSVFQRPLNAALSGQLGLADLSYDPNLARDLCEKANAAIAIKFLELDLESILDVSKYCAATQLFPQIRNCVLKSYRLKTQEILGSEAFVTSLRETPVFFKNLPLRSQKVRIETALKDDLTSSENEEKQPSNSSPVTHALVIEGLKTLMAFVRATDKTLATLFSYRFPEVVREQLHNAETIDDTQTAELRTLLARRGIS